MHKYFAIAIALALIGLSLRYLPVVFILVTVSAAVVVFSRCEYETAMHKRQLYTDSPPTKNTRRRALTLGILSGLWIGLIAGLLPAIMVGGAKSGGDWWTAGHFLITVLFALALFIYLRHKRGIRPLQFGLVKMALPTGLVFALIGMTKKPMPNKEAFDKTLDVLKAAADKDPSFDRAFEVLNSLFTLVDNVVGRICLKLFGEILGRIIHLFLTIDLAYGVSITVFALALLSVWDRIGYQTPPSSAGSGDTPQKVDLDALSIHLKK